MNIFKVEYFCLTDLIKNHEVPFCEIESELPYWAQQLNMSPIIKTEKITPPLFHELYMNIVL